MRRLKMTTKTKNKTINLKIISWITLIFYLLQPTIGVLANPNITTAANGVEVININTPNQNGLSYNQYDQFNVNTRGIIFNNSGVIGKTMLAGYILGNPNITANSARTILNEVIGMNPSYLNGYMEVAGNQANLIIANPNGIIGTGIGFINTSNVMLTTGRPLIDGQGILNGFNVNSGTIAIQGQGLNAEQIDRVDLIAKAVEINAGIWAKDLNIITGNNIIDTNLDVQSTDTNGNNGIALDVGILGGMYANKIKLIGTQNGVGVNSKGAIVATDALKLNQQGKIFSEGTMLSEQAIEISTKDELTNTGKMYANADLTVTAESMTNKDIIKA